MNLTQKKIALIKKIVNAHLSKDELKEVSAKTKEIINRRKNNPDKV